MPGLGQPAPGGDDAAGGSAEDSLGPALIRGLPKGALSVSADPTGQHLLIVSGRYDTTAVGTRTGIFGGASIDPAW